MLCSIKIDILLSDEALFKLNSIAIGRKKAEVWRQNSVFRPKLIHAE